MEKMEDERFVFSVGEHPCLRAYDWGGIGVGMLNVLQHPLDQWFTTFPMLRAFNTVSSSCCGDPQP